MDGSHRRTRLARRAGALLALLLGVSMPHPAAPSHVSAVMSGVMIKTGIYGIVLALTFLGPPPQWWGWLLIGIGETRRERIESLLAIRAIHEEFGHIQEIIIQNFRAKPGTKMNHAPEPDLEEMLWTLALARILFGSAMSIQAPPNLSPGCLPDLVAAATKSGAQLIDVRVPPEGLPVGQGRLRTGKRILMVGTDCAIGKKYSALALHRELERRGIKATFRATGQTGVMIAGEGIVIDAVIADFISGAAEELSPDNDDDHWDVIEGQGSLLNPSYSGVSLGLLHGSQPDAIVVCHDAERTRTLDVHGDYPIPQLDEVIDDVLRLARRTRPQCFCAGVSINTSKMDDLARDTYLGSLQNKLGLPCVDPIAIGMTQIANFLLKYA